MYVGLGDEMSMYVAPEERQYVERFLQQWWEPGEVYFYRYKIQFPLGTEVDSNTKVAALVKAFAQAHHQEYDTRGIAITKDAPGMYTVDNVVTSRAVASGPHIFETYTDEEHIAKAIESHPEVRSILGDGMTTTGIWLWLKGPANEVSYWNTAPILWNFSGTAPEQSWLTRSGEAFEAEGAPTQAFHKLENLWTGTAAKRLEQFRPLEPPPLFPPKGNGTGGRAPLGKGAWVGIALILGAGFWLNKRKKAAA